MEENDSKQPNINMSGPLDVSLIPARKPVGFQPGHPRMGGRKKGTRNKNTWAAREVADEVGIDPLRFMLEAVLYGSVPKPTIDGKLTKERFIMPLEERMKCARDLVRYLHTPLASIAITGADGGPIQVASLDVTKLMMNPELAAAAQQLALGITAGDLDRDDEDIIDAEEVSEGEEQ